MVITNNCLPNVNSTRTPVSKDKIRIIKSKTMYY